MTDTVDRATRSRIMAGIRASNTKPERMVGAYLHTQGLRYRKNVRGLPGTPDLVFPRFRCCVFVHGCFWHLHGCKDFVWPRSNDEFWRKKLIANRARDQSKIRELRKAGWRCKVVWECEATRLARSGGASKFGTRLVNWIRGVA